MTDQIAGLPPLAQGVVKLSQLLKKNKVRYALMGGIAIALHGVPRATGDADVLFNIEKIRLPWFLELLNTEGFSFSRNNVLKELTQDGLSQISFQKRRIDLFMPILPFFHNSMERTESVLFFGVPVQVVSAEDLILFKLIAFRTQDQEDIQAILAIKGKEQIQLDYLKKLAPKLTSPEDGKLQKLEEWIQKLT